MFFMKTTGRLERCTRLLQHLCVLDEYMEGGVAREL